jgi:ATP-dependent Lon protease
MIFSFNDPHLINPILLDRMTVLTLKGYSLKDKVNIARDYMLPKIYKEFAMPNLQFTESVLQYIVSLAGEEGGVRNLKRALEEIVSNINLCKMLDKDIIEGVKYEEGMLVTEKIVNEFVKRKHDNISLPMMYI